MDWTELYKNTRDIGEEAQSLKDHLKSYDIEERYIDKEFLSEGAMKRIYKCKDLFTGREVALAVPKSDEHSLTESFLREACISASLQHPNIVPIYDIGIDDDKPFFVMKLINGHNLSEIIFKKAQDLSLSQLLNIYMKVCDAIRFSHSLGIIHLDLKPENIQISEYGEVLICDWGLAKVTDWGQLEKDNFMNNEAFYKADTLQTTLFGYIKGTPGFLSPEQAQGSKTTKSYSSDIYSLGAILYAILTKQVPVAGDDLELLLEKTIKGEITRPRHVDKAIPSSLEAICLKALATEESKRYESVKALMDDVDLYLQNFSPKAEQASTLKKLSLFTRRSPLFMISLLSSVTIISILAFLSIHLLQKKNLVLAEQKKEIENNLRQITESKDYLKKISHISTEEAHTRAFLYYRDYHFAEATAYVNIVLNSDPNFVKSIDLQVELLICRLQAEEARKYIPLLKEKQTKLNRLWSAINYQEITVDTAPKDYLEYLKHFQRNDYWDFVRKLNYNFNKLSPHSTEKLETVKSILEMHNLSQRLKYSWSQSDRGYRIDLSDNPHLRSLHALSGLKIDELILKSSENLDFFEFISPDIRVFNLAKSKLDSRIISKLNKRNFPNLETLILDDCIVSERHLKDLKKTTITRVSLKSSHIKSYAPLEKLSQLESIIMDKIPENFPESLKARVRTAPAVH